MTDIAFIGLGVMGAPMARNLVRAGFAVTAYNRSTPALEEFAKAGGRVATSVKDAVSGATVAITMLPDSPDVRAVALNDGGVLGSLPEGSLYIDMSTIRPDVAIELAEVGRTRGIRVLDAPVSGGEHGAITASLSIMVGGSDEAFEAAQSVFKALGTTIVHVGPNGAGQMVKAANQLMVAGHLALLAEAIVFLDACGVSVADALRVIGGGLAGSKVLDAKGELMINRSFAPGFRLALHHKDLGIVADAARDAKVVLPVSTAAAQLVAAMVAQGKGSADHSAVIEVVEQLSGRGRPHGDSATT